jgi:hypothetical protein
VATEGQVEGERCCDVAVQARVPVEAVVARAAMSPRMRWQAIGASRWIQGDCGRRRGGEWKAWLRCAVMQPTGPVRGERQISKVRTAVERVLAKENEKSSKATRASGPAELARRGCAMECSVVVRETHRWAAFLLVGSPWNYSWESRPARTGPRFGFLGVIPVFAAEKAVRRAKWGKSPQSN